MSSKCRYVALVDELKFDLNVAGEFSGDDDNDDDNDDNDDDDHDDDDDDDNRRVAKRRVTVNDNDNDDDDEDVTIERPTRDDVEKLLCHRDAPFALGESTYEYLVKFHGMRLLLFGAIVCLCLFVCVCLNCDW